MKKLIVLATMFIAVFAMTGIVFADTPTLTITATSTVTPTFTPTFTATQTNFQVRVEGYAGWLADQIGDTNGAISHYYKKATACAGRLDKVGQAQAVFSAGHSLVKVFNSTSGYNQNLKRINLILTPSAKATAGSLYATSLTTTYTPLLDQAVGHLNYAASITGTSSDAATAASNKIKFDLALITAVRAWVASHL